MKLVSFLFIFIISQTITAQFYKKAEPFTHTYSIVARDSVSGDMAVAVQSHWFSVGSVVTYGKAGVVGLNGEIEHASAFIHTLRFGNKFRDAVGGTSYLSFTNTRGPAGSKMSIPMMHKTDSGLRPYYLTHEFTIHDAPFDDEIVIAIGGASSGRAHARTGDRYQDMKEMGLDPK